MERDGGGYCERWGKVMGIDRGTGGRWWVLRRVDGECGGY